MTSHGAEDILAHIAAYKRIDVAARKAAIPQTVIAAAAKAAPPPRGFTRALTTRASRGKPALIAEIKKASPSKGVIRPDFDPPSLARAYAQGGAACLSVLTDGPSFQGDDAYVALARMAAPALPALRKEFLVDPWQVAESRALGADAVLIIMAMIDDALAADILSEARRFCMDALIEVHDEAEMMRAINLGGDLLGINNRDLKSFHVDLAVFERLAPMAPAEVVLVGESGVFTSTDTKRLADAGASAVLVGESLMRQADVAAATRMLLS